MTVRKSAREYQRILDLNVGKCAVGLFYYHVDVINKTKMEKLFLHFSIFFVITNVFFLSFILNIAVLKLSSN